MKIKDQLHNSATHGEAPNKDCPVCAEHVPFDISCNRLRSTLRYMEAHSAQGSLTPEENNAIWQAVSRMDKAVSEVLAHASVRRDNQIETTLGPKEVEDLGACFERNIGRVIGGSR